MSLLSFSAVIALANRVVPAGEVATGAVVVVLYR
jgi:hypothetical protein